MTQEIFPENTIIDVAVNSTGNASIANIYAILDYNNITTLTPTFISGTFLPIPAIIDINSNVLNDIKNVYRTYPISDTSQFSTSYIENLIITLDNLLETVTP